MHTFKRACLVSQGRTKLHDISCGKVWHALFGDGIDNSRLALTSRPCPYLAMHRKEIPKTAPVTHMDYGIFLLWQCMFGVGLISCALFTESLILR